jgi:hypothetical protein
MRPISVVPTVSHAGGPCASRLDCQDLLLCVNGTCTRLGRLAKPCDSTDRLCAFAFACKNRDASGVGVCSTPTPPGGACNPSDDDCDYDGYQCDQFGMTCVWSEPTPKFGENCLFSQFCSFVAFCDANDICQAKPKEGQPATPKSAVCRPRSASITSARCATPRPASREPRPSPADVVLRSR